MSDGGGGFTILWEFEVAADDVAAFRRAYGPGGEWAALFRRSPGYLGTVLLADRALSGRFVTIDRWIDEAAHRAFRERHAAEYAALDEACAPLARAERELGAFVALEDTLADLA